MHKLVSRSRTSLPITCHVESVRSGLDCRHYVRRLRTGLLLRLEFALCDAPGLIGDERAAYHLLTILPRSGVAVHDPPAPVRWQGAQPASVHIFACAAGRHGGRRRGAAPGGWCASSSAHPRPPPTSASQARDVASGG